MRYVIVDCGAIGLELARLWGEAGHHVVGTTPDPARLPGIGEVCAEAVVLAHDDAERIREVTAGVDRVVLATRPALRHARTPRERVAAIRSMINVVRAASSVQRRLVLFSSVAVYGDAEDVEGPVTERTPVTTSLDPAGQGFAAVERIALQSREEAVVLRLPEAPLPSAPDLRRLRDETGGTLPYDGAALTHLIDPRDAAAAVAFVTAQGLTGVYNVVPDEVAPPRLEAYLGKLTAEAGLPPFTLTGELKAPTRPVSSAKLRAAGFEFNHS